MELKVIGTGSKGNCYALCFHEEILLIELGIKFEKILEKIDFKFGNIIGCIVSHTHNDHCQATKKALERGLKVYSNQSVKDKYPNTTLISERTQIGTFLVTPIKLFHDVECFGYLIEHEMMGRMIFATDTNFIPYKFKNINHFVIEGNYSEEVLLDNIMNDTINDYLADRIRESHLSIEKVCDFLNVNRENPIINIILIHFSLQNSNVPLFINKVYKTIRTINKNNISVANNNDLYILKKDVF